MLAQANKGEGINSVQVGSGGSSQAGNLGLNTDFNYAFMLLGYFPTVRFLPPSWHDLGCKMDLFQSTWLSWMICYISAQLLKQLCTLTCIY